MSAGMAAPSRAGDGVDETLSLSRIPKFDPLSVPVSGVDNHLPAIAPAALGGAALRQRFLQPPVWQPEIVNEFRFTQRSPAAAAVLVAIVERAAPTLLLTQRTQDLPTHAGQVAFAGGKLDPSDADAVAAALREAREELGLDSRHVEVLGSLPVYVTGTAFHVTPVVALLRPGFTLTPSPGEVADVFEVPLDYLMNPAHHRRHRIEFEGQSREWLSMPYDDAATGRQRFIWGATAGMLRNFYRFLSA